MIYVRGGSILKDTPAFVIPVSVVRPVSLLSTRQTPAVLPRSRKRIEFPGAGHGSGRRWEQGLPLAEKDCLFPLCCMLADFRAESVDLFLHPITACGKMQKQIVDASETVFITGN